jgi:bifunctional isochorismate lyase/aryl carrier protein
MQEYFLHPTSHACVPSASAIIPGLQSLVNAFTARKFLIVLTRHLNTTQDAGNMAFWWRDLITEENPLSVITPALDAANGVTLIKTQYDAFYNTALEAMLRERQVTQVVICGVMTHLCCETTARSAFTRGFEVFFTIDGTATYTQAHHRATLLNLAHGFAAPVLVDEILNACQRGNDEGA